MNRAVTVTLSVLVAGYLIVRAFVAGPGLDRLSTPNRTSVHVVERTLDLAAAGRELSAWTRWPIDPGTEEEAQEWAAWAYDEVLAAGLESDADAPLQAVADRRRDVERPRAVDPRLVAGLRVTSRVYLILVTSGLIVFAAWVCRGRLRPDLGAARVPAPWSAAEGYAVAVRAAAIGLLVVNGLNAATPELAVWNTLFGSVAMLLLVHARLLKPRGLGFRDAFGLGAPRRGSLLALATLAVFALTTVPAWAIDWTARALGSGAHWTDFVVERLLFGSPAAALMDSVDLIAWAPLFEEIGFRGLLYGTLRTRVRPVPAALLSGLLFAAIHFYSWPGLLALAWSGFLWAIVYEKTGSLWPCIAAHSLGNLFFTGSALLLFR